MVDGSTVLQVPDSVLMRNVQDEVVLLDLASEEYFGLDAVGACVLDAIQAGADVDGAIAAVSAEFDASEHQIRTDVLALVEDLIAVGLLAVRSRLRSGRRGGDYADSQACKSEPDAESR